MTTVNVSWANELVQGAEAEFRTVLDHLEKVYGPKLENFVIKEGEALAKDVVSGFTDGGSATTTATPSVATPVVDTPAQPTVPTPAETNVVPPGSAPLPTGNVVETSTGAITDPTGNEVAPTADVTATAPAPSGPTLEERLAAMSDQEKADLKAYFSQEEGDL